MHSRDIYIYITIVIVLVHTVVYMIRLVSVLLLIFCRPYSSLKFLIFLYTSLLTFFVNNNID